MLALISRKIPFILAASTLVGCAGSVEIGGTSGGSGGGPSTTATTATTTSGDPTTGSQGAGGAPTPTTGAGGTQVYACSGPNTAPPATACTPQDPGCNPGQSACAAVETVNGAPDFALKMAHVNFQKPTALAGGVAKSILQNWLGPQPPVCHIPSFLLTWVLQFHLAAGTLTTGGAVEGAGQAPGLQLINKSIDSDGFVAAMIPATGPLALGSGCDLDVTVGDVNVPVQYDENGAGNIYLPFRHLRFSGGKVTPDHNCIGRYADEKLLPDSSCAPPGGASPYEDGAEFHGMISLEDADKVIIGPLQQSLCVFLSSDPQTYGTQDGQFTRCKRDAGNKILLQGDFCAATNQAAQPGCADAVEVAATFAASGVKMSD